MNRTSGVEIKQRKCCGSCRAFRGGIYAACDLGYNVRNGRILYGAVVDGKPIEPCPKPLTVAEYLEATKMYNNKISKARNPCTT